MIDQTGTELLIGKTIVSAEIIGCPGSEYNDRGCDGENILILKFSDGTSVKCTGGYGGYTGESCDEYYEYIKIEEVK